MRTPSWKTSVVKRNATARPKCSCGCEARDEREQDEGEEALSAQHTKVINRYIDRHCHE
jgi:hypothetical protein